MFCYKKYDTHSHDILSFSVHVHSILIYLLKDGSDILGECDSNACVCLKDLGKKVHFLGDNSGIYQLYNASIDWSCDTCTCG